MSGRWSTSPGTGLPAGGGGGGALPAASPFSRPPFEARRALRSVAVFAGCCTVFGGLALTGHGLACPFRSMTGWLCPLCGSTTAGLLLLRGQWSQAWASNPLTLVGGSVLACCTVAWAIEAAGGPAVRIPARWRPPSRALWWAVVAIAVVFSLSRNLA